VKRNTRRPWPGRGPLPAKSVYLVCTETGDILGDILDRGPGGSWPGKGPGVVGRYHVNLQDSGCTADPPHRHAHPADRLVTAKMAQARRQRTSIPLRVSPLQ
jgi:hypothetical protein